MLLQNTSIAKRNLSSLWDSAATTHIALGASCGCSALGVNVSLADFEADILDYLLLECERQGQSEAHSVLLKYRKFNLRELLLRLDAEHIPVTARDWIHAQIARTTEPFLDRHSSVNATSNKPKFAV